MPEIDLAACRDLDAADPLARFRDRFALPDGVIYLDGNSLGALPRATAARVASVVEAEWGRDLIGSWTAHHWIDLPRRVGDKIARLVGAAPGEVRVADSTSVNLFKLMAAALRLRPGRRVILSEPGNFPTDLYVAEGLIDLLGQGHELRLAGPDELADAIDDDVALVSLTHVNYRSGRIHDMAAVTRRARSAGALTLWDLAHSAGAVPVYLNGCHADFAVGCGYKYLNGGPGAPAFLFAAGRHHDRLAPPLSGWMGHAAPFAFDTRYRPAIGLDRMLVGTPPVIGLAALEVGVDLMLEADMGALRAKSMALGTLFADLVSARCGAHGFRPASPADPERRGSQVCFAHEQGYAIVRALIRRGVIGDFRAPDILRFGFAPLYVGYADVWRAVEHLRAVMESGEWDRPEFHRRAAVT
ncbi:kynureninase [Skermanella pratensis]|uniref:kynureninase n=1 Tax=Skermanella pratensis TaxID=2233999 RepID=UPI0013019B0F|nr:kynureninase [Skermanella pratensis]